MAVVEHVEQDPEVTEMLADALRGEIQCIEWAREEFARCRRNHKKVGPYLRQRAALSTADVDAAAIGLEAGSITYEVADVTARVFLRQGGRIVGDVEIETDAGCIDLDDSMLVEMRANGSAAVTSIDAVTPA
jgi:hypothetical protein